MCVYKSRKLILFLNKNYKLRIIVLGRTQREAYEKFDSLDSFFVFQKFYRDQSMYTYYILTWLI